MAEQLRILKGEWITCVCCGLPLDVDSPVAKNGERCFDCTDLKFVDSTCHHRPDVCAKDREAVINVFFQVSIGNEVASITQLPSGRTLEWIPPADTK